MGSDEWGLKEGDRRVGGGEGRGGEREEKD